MREHETQHPLHPACEQRNRDAHLAWEWEATKINQIYLETKTLFL